ncbi:hypothetical protein MKZ38_002108 [Zalerion maritima]|uniref:Uncharacterized protein n=1 Tax=Zalerion maritima TaxID=339359 RepID=A0AAD5WTD8_9PEZI|nr:hypothetical protein MKZ38_002108 [Zalerion maritima]
MLSPFPHKQYLDSVEAQDKVVGDEGEILGLIEALRWLSLLILEYLTIVADHAVSRLQATNFPRDEDCLESEDSAYLDDVNNRLKFTKFPRGTAIPGSSKKPERVPLKEIHEDLFAHNTLSEISAGLIAMSGCILALQSRQKVLNLGAPVSLVHQSLVNTAEFLDDLGEIFSGEPPSDPDTFSFVTQKLYQLTASISTALFHVKTNSHLSNNQHSSSGVAKSVKYVAKKFKRGAQTFFGSERIVLEEPSDMSVV